MLLVCSPGGHLQDMMALEPAWRGFRRLFVTTPAPDVEYLLSQEPHVVAFGPTNRSLKNLIRNVPVALRVLRKERPDVVLSTGAALCVPFFVIGRVLGCRLVYVECLARVESLSLTGRLLYRLADEFFVQSSTLGQLERARYEGSVL